MKFSFCALIWHVRLDDEYRVVVAGCWRLINWSQAGKFLIAVTWKVDICWILTEVGSVADGSRSVDGTDHPCVAVSVVAGQCCWRTCPNSRVYRSGCIWNAGRPNSKLIVQHHGANNNRRHSNWNSYHKTQKESVVNTRLACIIFGPVHVSICFSYESCRWSCRLYMHICRVQTQIHIYR